jgi:hypothetical protein
VYDEVVENPYEDTGGKEEEALTGVINVYFPDMKKWIFEHLTKAAVKVSVCGGLAPGPLPTAAPGGGC